MLITTYYKLNEGTEGPRAEVHQGSNGYFVEFYNQNGLMVGKENFEHKSIHYVADVAENWVNGIKTLHG